MKNRLRILEPYLYYSFQLNVNQQFPENKMFNLKSERGMTNRYVKRFSTSLLIRKMQMKTARRYHLTLIGWLLSIKKIANVGKDVEKAEPL